ncbi:MAG: GNAT family N-acetyltransferase [Acidobacteria bacterium]|nr:GNAT family N-acetyltransferase [Acidobacteriota bacterium]
MRFLTDRKDLDSVLRLRFDVFNLELGEGLDSSYETGLDIDVYDPFCHHLVVEDADRNEIVGTYRLQTFEMACAGKGFYSAIEFDFSSIQAEVLQKSVELGRACIERAHRNTQVLYLLWRGLAAYVSHNRKRYLFGCCSLTSQDPDEGHLIMEQLEHDGRLQGAIKVSPLPGFECYPAGHQVDRSREVRLPRLFRTYLRFGARVCGAPAIDRQFRTIDYFVVFDIDEMDSQIREMFFQ